MFVSSSCDAVSVEGTHGHLVLVLRLRSTRLWAESVGYDVGSLRCRSYCQVVALCLHEPFLLCTPLHVNVRAVSHCAWPTHQDSFFMSCFLRLYPTIIRRLLRKKEFIVAPLNRDFSIKEMS